MSSSDAALLHATDNVGGRAVETELYAYAVSGDWIAGKSSRGWFLVNWQTNEHIRLASKEQFVDKLRELGLDPALKLKALYKDKRGRPY